MKKHSNPELFQGNMKLSAKQRPYFEGWYFKQVTAQMDDVISFIPGLCFGNDPHCFIQMINGTTGKTAYNKFPLDSFSFSKNALEITIGNNRFSKDGITLNIDNRDCSIKGSIRFSELIEWEKSLFAPGIMGWYGYVPFMECYHGLVSLNHNVNGALTVDGKDIDFSGGKGYIEKDWGKSFPKAWIWMQSNHFNDEPVSFMLSVAKIPWLGSTFTGFLGYLYTGNRIIPLATWKRHRLKIISHTSSELVLSIVLNRKESITVSAIAKLSGSLKAPESGAMGRIIKESVNGILKLDVDLRGYRKTLTGMSAGLESVYPDLL